jgi:hypothetical protein
LIPEQDSVGILTKKSKMAEILRWVKNLFLPQKFKKWDFFKSSSTFSGDAQSEIELGAKFITYRIRPNVRKKLFETSFAMAIFNVGSSFIVNMKTSGSIFHDSPLPVTADLTFVLHKLTAFFAISCFQLFSKKGTLSHLCIFCERFLKHLLLIKNSTDYKEKMM